MVIDKINFYLIDVNLAAAAVGSGRVQEGYIILDNGSDILRIAYNERTPNTQDWTLCNR